MNTTLSPVTVRTLKRTPALTTLVTQSSGLVLRPLPEGEGARKAGCMQQAEPSSKPKRKRSNFKPQSLNLADYARPAQARRRSRLAKNQVARSIVISSHKKRPACGWPFLGHRDCARRIRGLRLLEQGQHALLRLVGLGQHGGGGLRDDLRLGQVGGLFGIVGVHDAAA